MKVIKLANDISLDSSLNQNPIVIKDKLIYKINGTFMHLNEYSLAKEYPKDYQNKSIL